MARNALEWRTLTALILGVGIVVGAIFYTHHASIGAEARKAEAAETDALLASIASKDTDHDGLPDWEEELYGTSPTNAHSVDPTLSDGEAVSQGKVQPRFSLTAPTGGVGTTTLDSLPGSDPAPGSLTDAFAKAFLTQYLEANNGSPLDEASQQQLITGLISMLAKESGGILHSSYATSSLTIAPEETIASYAGAVETVFIQDDIPAGQSNPITLAEAAVNGDTKAAARLSVLADHYLLVARDLMRVRVPSSLVDTHMLMVHSFDELGQTTELVSHIDADPLAALLSLKSLETAPKGVIAAIESIAEAVQKTSGEPGVGEPGHVILNLARSAAAP